MRLDLEAQVKSLQHISSNFDRSAQKADTSDAEFENLVLIASARNSKIATITSKMKGMVQQYNKFNEAFTILLGQPAEHIPVASYSGHVQLESFQLGNRLSDAMSIWRDLSWQFGLLKEDVPGAEAGDRLGDKPGDHQEESQCAGASQQAGSQQPANQQADGQLKKVEDVSANSYVKALKDIQVAPGEVAVMRYDESPKAVQPSQWHKVTKKQKGKRR